MGLNGAENGLIYSLVRIQLVFDFLFYREPQVSFCIACICFWFSKFWKQWLAFVLITEDQVLKKSITSWMSQEWANFHFFGWTFKVYSIKPQHVGNENGWFPPDVLSTWHLCVTAGGFISIKLVCLWLC